MKDAFFSLFPGSSPYNPNFLKGNPTSLLNSYTRETSPSLRPGEPLMSPSATCANFRSKMTTIERSTQFPLQRHCCEKRFKNMLDLKIRCSGTHGYLISGLPSPLCQHANATKIFPFMHAYQQPHSSP